VEPPSLMKGFGSACLETGQSLEPDPPESTTESNRIFVLLFERARFYRPEPDGNPKRRAVPEGRIRLRR
jgi:hypothetical protein